MSKYIIPVGVEDVERMKIMSSIYDEQSLAWITEVYDKKFKDSKTVKIMDAGCGNGDMALKVYEILYSKYLNNGISIHGIDNSEEQISVANDNKDKFFKFTISTEVLTESLIKEQNLKHTNIMPHLKKNVNFSVGDINNLSIGEPFDIIYLRFVLIHQSNPHTTMNKLKEYLAKDGVIIIQDVYGNPYRDNTLYNDTIRTFDLWVDLLNIQHKIQSSNRSIMVELDKSHDGMKKVNILVDGNKKSIVLHGINIAKNLAGKVPILASVLQKYNYSDFDTLIHDTIEMINNNAFVFYTSFGQITYDYE